MHQRTMRASWIVWGFERLTQRCNTTSMGVCVCGYTACFDPDDASQQMKTCEYTDKIHT